jgi:four helix bundle protein
VQRTGTQPEIRDYKDLVVWQKGMQLARQVYQLTQSFPAEEKFGLVSQMRRAAVSVPSNIAEGQARNTTGEFVQFVSHAEGSLAELVRLSIELRFCHEAAVKSIQELIIEEQKMLKSLRRSLKGERAYP